MAVIAKMRVVEITDRGDTQVHDSYAGESRKMRHLQVKLMAVTGSGSDEMDEDEVFNRSTPVGSCDLTILNPLAAEQFQVGEHFYVRFSAADQ